MQANTESSNCTTREAYAEPINMLGVLQILIRALLLAGLITLGRSAPAEVNAGVESVTLEAAMADFAVAVDEARRTIEQHPYYRDDAERVAGTSYLFAMLLRRIEVQIQQDPDFPMFSSVDYRVREGGDNPDQHYQSATVRSGATYRIWGRRGTARRLDFQIYEGAPYLPGGGRAVSALNSEDLRVDSEGRFEVTLSLDRAVGNWLPTSSDTTAVLVRQTFGDWNREIPAEVHIDRVGYEGAIRPTLTSEAQTERVRRAAASLRATVANWPEFVRRGYVDRVSANTLTPPVDTSAQGGLPGRWYSSGWWQLEDDEALILTAWPMPGNYQGIQLTDLWFSSLEYANRQTSLNGDQTDRSPDGVYRIVIAARDPGVANWLDTTGLRRGVIMLRFDGMGQQPFPADKYPTLEKVKFADLSTHLPTGTPRISAEQRTKTLRERRAAIQRRYGR